MLLSYRRDYGHVAIYIGHNKIVNTSNPSRGVRIDGPRGW